MSPSFSSKGPLSRWMQGLPPNVGLMPRKPVPLPRRRRDPSDTVPLFTPLLGSRERIAPRAGTCVPARRYALKNGQEPVSASPVFPLGDRRESDPAYPNKEEDHGPVF